MASFNWNSPTGTMAVRIVGLAVNYGLLAWISSRTDQASLGIVIALNSMSFVLGSGLAFGFPTYLLKANAGHLLAGDVVTAAAEYKRALKIVALPSGVAMLLCWMVSSAQWIGYAPRFGVVGAAESAALGCGVIALACQGVTLSAIRAMKKPAISGLFQFLTQPLFLMIAILVALSVPGDLHSNIALATGGAMLLNAISTVIYLSQKMPGSADSRLKPLCFRELRGFWTLSILSNCAANAPLLLAGVLVTADAVASIGVPFRICNLPMTLVVALGTYYAPVIREAHLQKDFVRQKRKLTESQWIGFGLVLPILLGSVIFPSEILGLFSLHDPLSNICFIIFSFAQLIVASCGVSEQFLLMTEKVAIANRYTLWAVGGSLLGGYLGYKAFGVIGLAGVWGLVVSARQLGLLKQSRRSG